MVKVYFVVQVDNNNTMLGVRSIHLDEDSAEAHRQEAVLEFSGEIARTGWPIWKVIEKEVTNF